MQDVLDVQSVRAVRSVRSVPRERDGGRQGCSSDRVKSHIAYTAVLRTVNAYSNLIVKTGVQDALNDNNAAADFYAALDRRSPTCSRTPRGGARRTTGKLSSRAISKSQVGRIHSSVNTRRDRNARDTRRSPGIFTFTLVPLRLR